MSKRKRSADSNLSMSSKKSSRRRQHQEEESDDDDVVVIDLEPPTNNGNSKKKGGQNGASSSKKKKLDQLDGAGGGSKKKNLVFNGVDWVEREDQPETNSEPPGTGLSSFKVPNVPRRQNQGLPAIAGPSTSAAVPTTVAQESKKIGQIAESVPTLKQLDTTKDSRKLRQAFIGACQDALDNACSSTPVNDIENLAGNLYDVLKTRLYVFATRRLPEGDRFEDVSEDAEVEEFAYWWFFTLTALLFSSTDEVAKKAFVKTRDVLAELSQLLICGHPSVVDSMGLQLIKALMVLLIQYGNDGDAIPTLDLTLVKTDFPTQVKEKFNYKVKITKGNEWLLPHYFHAISPLTARIYYRNLRLSRFYDTFLLNFVERTTSPAVVATILDALPCHLLTTGAHRSFLAEKAGITIFRKILEAPTVPGTNSLQMQLLFHEQRQLENNRCADFFQDSGLYQLQVGLRSFLYSDKFFDVNKNGLGKIMMTLIEFIVQGTPRSSSWVEKDAVAMVRKVSSIDLDKIFHPILQEVIVSEFLLYWNTTGSAENNPRTGPRQVQPKEVSAVWNRISELWGKSLSEHLECAKSSCNVRFQMPADEETKIVTFFEKTSSLVKFVRTLSQQLRQQGKKERYLFFEQEHFRNWSEIVFFALANGPRMTKVKLQSLYFAILDTLEELDRSRWFGVQLTSKMLNDFLCIPGLPWLKAYNFAIPDQFKPIHFAADFSLTDQQFIKKSSILTSKAIRALRLEEFRPWSLFVSEIYNLVLADPATMKDPFLVSELLCAIASVSWVFKEVVDLVTTFTFLNKVTSTTLWVAYAFVRSSLASAITALPCICSYNVARNRPDYRHAVPLVSRSGCERRKCPNNYVPRSESDNFGDLDDKYIKAIVQLSLPLLQGKFLLAKMTLSDLIIACHNHVNTPSESVILPMIEVALNGHVVLCQEIFRKVGVVVMNNSHNDSILMLDCEVDIVQKVFSVAIPEIRELKEQKLKKRLPLKTRERIMEGILAFSTVGRMTNMSVFVEIMRCVIPIVALSRGNENSVTIFAQKIVTHFAEVHNCQPYELMSRVRREISKCIVNCALKEFSRIGEKKVNLCAKFIERIKYIGKFRRSFVQFFYPPLMELIVPHLREDEKHYRFLLSALASACNDARETEHTLLEEYIMYYFPSLLLEYPADTIKKCLVYLRVWYEFDAMFAAKQQEQRIINEAICRLHDRQEKALRFLPLLCKWDDESNKILSTGFGKSVSRSELQELLSKRLLGFFIHLDTKLQSRIETVRAKEKIVMSFTILMGLMGKSKITPVRSKVYKTLYSATKDGAQLHIILYDAWRDFAANLDSKSFASMTTQILASILPLRQTSCIRKKVDGFISHFVCFKKELTAEHHQELYFLLGQCDDQDVIKVIGDAVNKMKENNWSDYFNMIVREASNDNPPIRYEAFKKLREVFRFDWELIEKFVLVKGKDYVSQIISTLLAGFRGTGSAPEDAKLREIIVECFGAMGALDPVRFRSTDDDGKSKNSLSTSLAISGQMNSFVVMYLSELCREFQEVKDTTNFDFCACLIQIVLKEFKVSQNSEDKVWKFLSKENQELITPMFNTKYQMEHGTSVRDLSVPIYLSDHGKTFDSWLINWLCYLIMCITEKEQQAFALFRKSMNVLKTNARITMFIIPFVAMYAIFCATEDQRRNIITEIQTVLERWVVLDEMKRKANSVAPVRDSEVDNGVKEEEVTLDNESIFHNRCTQVVFSVLDHLLRSSSLARRRWNAKKEAEKPKAKGSLRSSIVTPPMSEWDLRSVESVLKEIHPLLISEVAYNCTSFPMALYYLEQDLKNNPSEENLQKNVDYLQKIYISLDDMDSVGGVSAIRRGYPTFAEQILENLVKGRTQESVKSLEEKVVRDQDNFQLHNALIRGYLMVEEPHAAETFIKATLDRLPEWKLDLQEVQMQSLVKLQQWDNLHTVVESLEKMKGNECLEDKFLTWNVAIPRVMSKMQRSQLDAAIQVVTELKSDLIAPLVATCEDMYPYKQAYPLIVKTHILTEIDDSVNLLRKFAKCVLSGKNIEEMGWLSKELNRMVCKWETRLWNVSQSRKMIDQILSVRKSIFEIMKATFRENRPACDSLSESIRNCWLDMAKDASKFGDFARADNCILQAKEYMSPQVMIEEAKVLSRKGEKERAISSLQHGIAQCFPHFKSWRNEKIHVAVGLTSIYKPRLQCSKALLLQARLCEEVKLLDMEDQVKSYKDAVDVYSDSEKNLFTLGSYHDRLWSISSKEKPCFDIQHRIVSYYALSLHHGCKYIYQSLPRLLSIWFDFAAGLHKGDFKKYTTSGLPATIQGEFEVSSKDSNAALATMRSSVQKMTSTVPAFILMTAFSQLVSRLCHAHPETWNILKDILVRIISTHPNQTLWLTMAVHKSVNPLRRRRCMEIFRFVEQKHPSLKQIIKDHTDLTEKLIDLCNKTIPERVAEVSLIKLYDKLPKLIRTLNGRVAVPFQVFINPLLPRKGINCMNHNPYPEQLVFISGIDDVVEVMSSLVRPKKITIRASNGKNYGLLCKPKDDLRKDSKVMEVNNVVNWYLSQNPDSSQRCLHVRTYSVVPLNEECGLLEWVPNLSPFRHILSTLYKEKNMEPFLRPKDLIKRDEIGSTLVIGLQKAQYRNRKFVEIMLKQTTPIFSDWFFNQFNDHQSWYTARMSYMRTAAVISIVGYIMGLGDRHGENFLLDSITGEVVHVDFNCIFNKGESFDWPELVPFRLTQNMVEGMGPLGYEGVFRKSCEIVLNMFREHRSIFLSVLRPFVFDPLVEWQKQQKGMVASLEAGESTNEKAVETMKNIRHRLNGTGRISSKVVSSELSVEAHVNYLIDEATSVDNLSQMWIGWAAYM